MLVELGVRVNTTRPKESGAVTEPEEKKLDCPTVPPSLKSKTLPVFEIEVPVISRMPPIANESNEESRPRRLNAYPPDGAAVLVWRSTEPVPVPNVSNSEISMREVETGAPRNVSIPL